MPLATPTDSVTYHLWSEPSADNEVMLGVYQLRVHG